MGFYTLSRTISGDYALAVGKLLFFLALVLAAAPCTAQTNLEPDDAPLIAAMSPRHYGSDYGRKLKPAIGSDVRIFAVIEGGLVPDFAVGLKSVGNGYRIFMIGERHDDGLDRCETRIGNDLATDLIFAWDKVLRQSRKRADRPQGGADVPFYHFGSRLPSGLVIGRVWDTPPNSNPAQLAQISSGLLQLCSPHRVQPIRQALAEIRTALSKIHGH